MDNQQKYNGWSNYATWRFNLEFVDTMRGTDLAQDWERLDLHEQAAVLKEAAEEFIHNATGDTTVSGWAQTFLDDVNFIEVAKHMNED